MSDRPSAKLEREIEDHPFFRPLPKELVRTLAAGAGERTFEAGETIANAGAAADVFYLVLHGKVALELDAADRRPITVQTVGPGELVGWSWLIPPHRWRFNVRAVKPTRLVSIDGGAARRTLHAHPTWGYEFLLRFLPVLGERLENARVQLLDIYGR